MFVWGSDWGLSDVEEDTGNHLCGESAKWLDGTVFFETWRERHCSCSYNQKGTFRVKLLQCVYVCVCVCVCVCKFQEPKGYREKEVKNQLRWRKSSDMCLPSGNSEFVIQHFCFTFYLGIQNSIKNGQSRVRGSIRQELTLRDKNVYIMEAMTCFTHFAYFYFVLEVYL